MDPLTVHQGSFDASTELEDIFLISGSRLAPTDQDEKPDLFDARVDGGFPAPPSPKPCSAAESCRTRGSAVPGVASPGSEHLQMGGAPEKSCPRHKVRRHGRCVAPRPHKHAGPPKKKRSSRRHRHHGNHAHRGHGRKKGSGEMSPSFCFSVHSWPCRCSLPRPKNPDPVGPSGPASTRPT